MRGLVLTGAFALAAAGGVALSGSGRSETYDLPIAQVSQAMMRTGVPPGMGTGLLTTGDVSVEQGPGHRVEWKFRREHNYVGALVAVAEAKGDNRTKLTISFDPGAANANDRKVADAQEFVTTVGLPVMYESLDSKIERREANAHVFEDAMASYVQTNGGAIGRETNALFSEVSKSMRESASSEDRPMSTYEATKPAIDLSKK